MTLESKENYPRHTKIVQNSLGFMPEVKPLHKPRGDLVLCARNSKINTRALSILESSCLHWVLKFGATLMKTRKRGLFPGIYFHENTIYDNPNPHPYTLTIKYGRVSFSYPKVYCSEITCNLATECLPGSEKFGKKRRENQPGRKDKNWEDSFTLPLLTETGTGYTWRRGGERGQLHLGISRTISVFQRGVF